MEEKHIKRAIDLSLTRKDTKDKEELTRDVQKVIEFVDTIKDIETSDSDATEQKINVLREDKVTVPSGEYKEFMLNQAPEKTKDFILSKKIL